MTDLPSVEAAEKSNPYFIGFSLIVFYAFKFTAVILRYLLLFLIKNGVKNKNKLVKSCFWRGMAIAPIWGVLIMILEKYEIDIKRGKLPISCAFFIIF